MFQHVKQKIVVLLTVLCLTAGAGTAVAAEPAERQPTLLEMAAKVSKYANCRSLPLRERPQCAKEFALKSLKLSLAVGTYLHISQPAMKDEGAAFAEVNKEMGTLAGQLRPLLTHANQEADPERRKEIFKQLAKTYKAARPHLDKFRTQLFQASELADAIGEPSAEFTTLLSVYLGDYFPERKPVEPVPDGPSIFDALDELKGIGKDIDQIIAGLDQMNEALDEMNATMVQVNESIDGINKGLEQANRGMDKLNEGVREMNEGLGQMNTAVRGFNKTADKILSVPDIKFDFSHINEKVGANQTPPEVLAAQDRKMGSLLNLLPGIGDGKGVVEALRGKDLATGEELSVTDRALGALVVLRWVRTGGTLTADAIRAARKGDRVAGCFDSFPAGTPVLMADGATRPIEQIEPGDTVLATDPEAGVTGPRPVEGTIYTPDDRDFTGITLSADAGRGTLTATDHHPFWSENRKQWTDAADLNSGDTLRTPDGATVEIEKVAHWKELRGAYNLTVNDLHTYYVLAGATPVLVHNSNGLCSRPGAIAKATGYSVKQIKDAIHKVKAQGGWRGIGGNRNPDMLVDPRTGDVHPQMPDGRPGDIIGNIFEHLPDRP
ncbi:polymorphic toxin-type HINT domain-containing protein [Streptomyces antarcticus]|uniref:polymorphic toxin-type HINT domain-containing protein n=1 Tax=Streptomyces antarcticus TaxID=2996458 RepID=UPI0022708E65|nr:MULTISPECIES: polymorphic toxin-type HINT domain-containing protein [unclassified Streptomyces]MCY0943266.1 polymorphic toxin-type HINT domain-containing protein [Streptomyces sp. H34-AA3]MCZ4082544.1 polymorphic toxin-type HINT domain-containing protein [Streptomyces sp. H34-S5]